MHPFLYALVYRVCPAIREATAMEKNFSSALEPRLVGSQMGLHPLLTLVCIYVGYRLWGVLGMLLAPMLVITAQELAQLLQPGRTGES